jgi:ABC-type molybdate transport system ATPase subunit
MGLKRMRSRNQPRSLFAFRSGLLASSEACRNLYCRVLPTSALDPELRDEVLHVMRQLAEEGMTMIVVTHETQFARDMAGSILFFDCGRVAEFGPPDQIFSAPKNEINCDERSFLLDSPLQNQRVISPCLATFLRADDIMPCLAQKRSQFNPKHLIQVKAHGGSRNIQGRDFRVQNGMPGVLQGSLNVVPRQFRVASQQ